MNSSKKSRIFKNVTTSRMFYYKYWMKVPNHYDYCKLNYSKKKPMSKIKNALSGIRLLLRNLQRK